MKVSPQRQHFSVVTLLLLWCMALLFCRLQLIAEWIGLGLIWNLLLATVPLFWSTAFQVALRRQQWFWAAISFGLWLLFLPNAPYILTDLIHLDTCPAVAQWYVLAVLLSCAGTGTLLGYISLNTVQHTVEEKFGKGWGWGVTSASLLLCGFGIYLGRFLRWNSWDALTKPLELGRAVVGQFIDSGPHPHPMGVTLVFGIGLMIGYVALRTMAPATPG